MIGIKWFYEFVNNFFVWEISSIIFTHCKIIESMADFEDIIRSRRSIRKFKNKIIEKDKIDKLIHSALLAPSGKRMYPCEFIVVDDVKILDQISKAKQHGAEFINKAPLAIVVIADTLKYDIWVEDASIAAAYIMLEAENLGLGCCWVQMRMRGTMDGKTASENLKIVLNLKDKHEILSVLAIGYKDEEKSAYKLEDLKVEKIHRNQIGSAMY